MYKKSLHHHKDENNGQVLHRKSVNLHKQNLQKNRFNGKWSLDGQKTAPKGC